MYDFDHNTCIRLDMQMGPPMPDWFLTNSSIVGIEYQMRDQTFYKVTLLSSPSPLFSIITMSGRGRGGAGRG
jgi:hypothetical protein